MIPWTFKDYWTEDGRNLIWEWYEAQDEEVQAAFDGTLLRLRAVDDWLDQRVKEFDLLKRHHAGLGELRFSVMARHPATGKSFKRRFRPVGVWRQEERDFIILLGCEKTGGNCHSSFDLALQYKALFEQGRGTIREHV